MQNNDKRIYDKSTLNMIYSSQQSVDNDYDPKTLEGGWARSAERQTAELLEDYASGVAIIDVNDETILADILDASKNTGYYRLKDAYKKANDKYKLLQITRHKEEEKKKNFVASRFKILNNKKEASRLSSNDMIIIAKLLEEEKGYSTQKLKDKLKSFAMERINKTMRGELPQDEHFSDLVNNFGTYQQKNAFRTMTEKQNSTTTKPKTKEVSVSKVKVNEEPMPKSTPKVILADDEKPVSMLVENSYNGTPNTTPKVVENSYNGIPNTTPKVVVETTKDKKVNNTSKDSVIKRFWKKSKKYILGCVIILAGVIGAKTCYENNKTSEKTTTSSVKKAQKPQTVTNKQQGENNKPKTADFTKELDALNKAYKNRFDTALKIILGEKKRDNLYQQIDKMAKDGKISFSNGTTREWYAHAFTIYRKVAPNSAEAREIRKLLRGQEVDKDYINSLVIKAGRDGKGVTGKGTHSSFDKASAKMQKEHINSRKAVKNAELALAKARASKSL